MYKRERCEKYYFIHVTFGAHVGTWVISAGERDCLLYIAPQVLTVQKIQGRLLKRRGTMWYSDSLVAFLLGLASGYIL